MKVHVAYLGPARDWAGAEADTFDLPDPADLGALITRVVEVHAQLGTRRAILRFAVNDAFADTHAALSDGDRVAVIPPVSGGSDDDLLRIVDGPIDTTAVHRHLHTDAQAGGVVTFEGVTRPERHAAHGALIRLDYEASRRMALNEMSKLAKAARGRWSVHRSAIVHRIGTVPVGQTSVVVGVTCAHRAEAFDACRFLIDALKREVPIWKKEIWETGASTWVDPTGAGAER